MSSSMWLAGLRETKAKLSAYVGTFEQRKAFFLGKIAKSGVDVSKVIFRQAIYDGTNDVVVGEPKWISPNEVEVLAVGNAVTFIEFGSGVHYSKQHPFASEMGAIRGEYGKGRGKRDVWGYYGDPGSRGKIAKTNAKGDLVLTHGNPPARAMYLADKAMRDMVLRTVKEAFGS